MDEVPERAFRAFSFRAMAGAVVPDGGSDGPLGSRHGRQSVLGPRPSALEIAHKGWKNRREERAANASRQDDLEPRIKGVVRAELGEDLAEFHERSGKHFHGTPESSDGECPHGVPL